MWDIVSSIIQFVGYVFAFWLMWRVLDGLVHRASKKKKEKEECSHCLEYEKQIRDLQQRTRLAEQKSKEKYTMEAAAEEAIAIGQLNIASKTEIEEIDGVGPVRAAKIIAHRPYFSWVHFDGIESRSSVRNAIFRWSKERIGLVHRPQPRHNPWNR
jgi:DNA uptake protein ComE-like DNA-binding protein